MPVSLQASPATQAAYSHLVRKLADAGDLDAGDAIRIEQLATALGKNASDITAEAKAYRKQCAEVTQEDYEQYIVRVAYHEAAHAIVLLACAGEVQMIIAATSRQGGGLCTGSFDASRPLTTEERLKRGAFGLAGEIGPVLCRIPPSEYAVHFDFGALARLDQYPEISEFSNLMTVICTGDDESFFKEDVSPMVSAGASIEHVREQATDLALMILLNNRDAIEALASELITHRVLKAERIREFVLPLMKMTGDEAMHQLKKSPWIGMQLRLMALAREN